MPDQRILMGVIGRPHGVRGLLRVHSYTADPAALPEYGPFDTKDGRRFVLRWKTEGVAELAELKDGAEHPVRDRTLAEKLVNLQLFIDRSRLPPTEEDEFYLADLVGMQAVGLDGTAIGTVAAVHDYGAGTSLEIGPLLLPFTRACVPVVDLASGRLTICPPDEVVAPS